MFHATVVLNLTLESAIFVFIYLLALLIKFFEEKKVHLMNSREDLETLKTGKVYGRAISLIFSMTWKFNLKYWNKIERRYYLPIGDFGSRLFKLWKLNRNIDPKKELILRIVNVYWESQWHYLYCEEVLPGNWFEVKSLRPEQVHTVFGVPTRLDDRHPEAPQTAHYWPLCPQYTALKIFFWGRNY